LQLHWVIKTLLGTTSSQTSRSYQQLSHSGSATYYVVHIAVVSVIKR